MKKALLILASLAAFAAIGYFSIQSLLPALSKQATEALAREGRHRGVHLDEFSIGSTRLSPSGEIHWSDVSAQLRMEENPVLPRNPPFRFTAETIRLDLSSVGEGRMAARLENFRLAARTGASEEERIEGEFLTIELPFSWAAPAESLRSTARELESLIESGGTSVALEFEGQAVIFLGDRLHQIPIRTLRSEGRTELELDRDGLRRMSRSYERQLTEAEIELVATHPLQAPAMLRLKEYAERTAKQVSRRDPAVDEDAFRHLLWSFILTRQFGPDFAQEVTDAHELGRTGNTPAERQMDFENNAIGREYALQGLDESDLLEQYQSDPRIVRSPRLTASRRP